MDASCKIQRSIHDVRLTYKYVSRILGTYQNLAALRRLFFFCRRPADYYLLSKKESRQQQLHGTACYRLCVCASGSLITVIFKSFTLTRVSCLHLGQNKGKFFNSVSSRILLRVLLPQTGQTIHLLLSMM